MAEPAETEQQRGVRHRQRVLFDGVAQLYQSTRPGYPAEIIAFMLETAGVGAASSVLEIGCGPGQLTRDLARYGFRLTAIDIGQEMIAAARRSVRGLAVEFQVTPFEDFAAADASFDLVVSATAFHWIDPEVKFSKPARLLRPGGWLAILSTGERYDDPLGAALDGMWAARSDGQVRRRPPPDEITASGLFGEPVHREHEQRTVLAPEAVIGLENTRATPLSWPAAARQAFTEELRAQLGSATEVQLTQHTALTMAQVS